MGQKSEIDKDEVKGIIQALQKNLETLQQGTGSRNDFVGKAQLTPDELGNYQAASGIIGSSQAAYTQVSTQYDAFISSYQGLIDALNRAVGNHEETNRYNAANANQVGANMNGPAPTTNNTSAF